MTRVVAFVNGALGAGALRSLERQLAAVVLHASDRCRDEPLLMRALPPSIPVFRVGDDLPTLLPPLQPTHGISVLFGHILKPPVLSCFSHGVANVHTSLLPYGRGAHPNAWAIADSTPAGVTLHLIDEGVDTGPILAQRRVDTLPTDTARDLYQRLMDEAERLMSESIPLWLAGKLRAVAQAQTSSPTRRARDLDEILRIDPEKTYTGRQIVDLLRARTFPPYPGALYGVDRQRLRVRIEIEREVPP